MKKLLLAAVSVVGIFAAMIIVNQEFQSPALQGQVVATPQTLTALRTGKMLPSNEADLGITLAANQTTHFSCGGRDGVQFKILGSGLKEDTTTRITVTEYDWNSKNPTGKVFYSPATRQADHSLPPSTLQYFSRGKTYDVQTSQDLVFQCGLNMDVVYSCGNGIVEGQQSFKRLGINHPAEECDGSIGCTKECKNG